MLEYTCQLYQEGSWKEYRNQHSPSKCWSIPVNCTRKVPEKNTEINIHLPNVGVYLSTVPGRFLKRIQKSTFTFQMLEYTCQLYQEGSWKEYRNQHSPSKSWSIPCQLYQEGSWKEYRNQHSPSKSWSIPCQLYQEGSWKEYRNQHSPSKCWSIPVNCTRKVPEKNTEINIHLPNVGVYLSTVSGRFLKRIQKSTFTFQMLEYTLSTVPGRFLKRIQKSTFTFQMLEYTLSTVPGRFLERIQKSTFTFQMLEYTCQLYQEGS